MVVHFWLANPLVTFCLIRELFCLGAKSVKEGRKHGTASARAQQTWHVRAGAIDVGFLADTDAADNSASQPGAASKPAPATAEEEPAPATASSCDQQVRIWPAFDVRFAFTLRPARHH